MTIKGMNYTLGILIVIPLKYFNDIERGEHEFENSQFPNLFQYEKFLCKCFYRMWKNSQH